MPFSNFKNPFPPSLFDRFKKFTPDLLTTPLIDKNSTDAQKKNYEENIKNQKSSRSVAIKYYKSKKQELADHKKAEYRKNKLTPAAEKNILYAMVGVSPTFVLIT
ncbi:hypothetical protein QN362_01455 [Actimicrobium sp. CCC2.4]|uniref:hypothetical protein n=1 Tax=Actimicrobium sp. CCC2.4 TaxID=3048606 RepID=UPI002AC97F85|nr:hypothetical protein [Actimicrobium sp. CCC2.4]MEB0133989.1 hypothetical protein [Actimicrobium sp. CCC2.4]WPX31525.1 hypothetical protein RHM62_14935 [Actimicrobium sp. CCC2.4]